MRRVQAMRAVWRVRSHLHALRPRPHMRTPQSRPCPDALSAAMVRAFARPGGLRRAGAARICGAFRPCARYGVCALIHTRSDSGHICARRKASHALTRYQPRWRRHSHGLAACAEPARHGYAARLGHARGRTMPCSAHNPALLSRAHSARPCGAPRPRSAPGKPCTHKAEQVPQDLPRSARRVTAWLCARP